MIINSPTQLQHDQHFWSPSYCVLFLAEVRPWPLFVIILIINARRLEPKIQVGERSKYYFYVAKLLLALSSSI